MLNPSELYRFETDTEPQELRASVMVVSLGGFMDAGHTQRLLTEHLLATSESSVVACFDVDQLMDYRGRRPGMVFDTNRWVSYEDPCLALHRLSDREGTPYFLLAGPEPDYQWEPSVSSWSTSASTWSSRRTASRWRCRTRGPSA